MSRAGHPASCATSGSVGSRPATLAEKVVAEAIVKHLELYGWRMEHHPKPAVTATS